MLKRSGQEKLDGQVFSEYALVLGLVVMVIVAMTPLLKRGLQGLIKTVADEVGIQADAEQKFDESGHLERAYSSTRSSTDKTLTESAGVLRYTYDDTVRINGLTVSNLGFTKTE